MKSAAPVKILIVEDSEVFRQLLCAFVRESFPWVEVLEAETVADAQRVVLLAAPHIAFVDIGLPDGSGLDVARAIKGHLPGTWVAMCTSHDTLEYREAAAGCGVERFMCKSTFRGEEVCGFIEEALGRLNPEEKSGESRGANEATALP